MIFFLVKGKKRVERSCAEVMIDKVIFHFRLDAHELKVKNLLEVKSRFLKKRKRESFVTKDFAYFFENGF